MYIKTAINIMTSTLTFNFYLVSFKVEATHISRTSCTNSCVTTTNMRNGTTSTQDCCGGSVTTVIQAHGKQGEP